MTDDSEKIVGKPRGRPFEPGNPGKPHGARHKKTMLLEKMLADDGEAVVKAVVEAAKAGDMTAAKMIVDRILPASKGRHVSVAVPPMKSAADLPAAHDTILDAVAEGELTPDEASTLAGIVEMRRKALETNELEQRIAAIEARQTK